MKPLSFTFALLLALTLLAAPIQADWPSFRGPNADGHGINNINLPTKWSEQTNIKWKTPVAGTAWSSPIVIGNQVILTTAATEAELEEIKKGLYFGGERKAPHKSTYRWEVHSYDLATGKLNWKSLALKQKPDSSIHLKNSYASETPTSDGKRIYAYFGSAGLYCYSLNGELIWKKDLGTFKTRYGWGTASSPIVDNQHLYIQADNDNQSYLLALDKMTGQQVWRRDREEHSNWSTPFLWKTPSRTELVTTGTDRVRSYDPKTGKTLWTLTGMSTIVIPTPFTAHGLLYITSGYVGDKNHRPIFAIRPNAKGDISLKKNETSNQHIAWFQPLSGPYNTTPIIVGDYMHVLHDRGIMTCFDAKTGEEIYKERVTSGQGQFTASPWAYDGNIFCLNESGQTFVIPAGPKFKITRTNQLDDEMFMSTPALANNRLLIRGLNHLYCIQADTIQ